LDDIEPPEFNVFVEWLYTQKLPADGKSWNTIANQSKSDLLGMLRLKLYVLADRLIVPSLHRLLNRAIVNVSRIYYVSPPPYENIIYAFQHLPPSDSILDYFIDIFYMGWDSDIHDRSGEDNFSDLPQDFLLRLLTKMGKERKRSKYRQQSLYKLDVCSYHAHASDEERASCPNKAYDAEGKMWMKRESEKEDAA